MQRIILTLFCAMFFFSIQAQTSGSIIYESTVQIDRNMKRWGRELPDDIKNMIPKERSSYKELIFSSEASTYKNKKIEQTEEVDMAQGEQRLRMRFMRSRENDMTYKNLSEKTSVEQRDLMGKTFLIEDSVANIPWKITGEKKMLNEYLCMEASTMEDDTVQVIAWFTPQIPVSTGPGKYGGLPGMILEMDIDEGQRIYQVTEINLREIDESLLEKPTKGKKVTREEFNEIRKEKMEEMREQHGGRYMITRRRD